MKRQSGIILLSVISLLMIGTAFEHPEQTVDAVTSRPTPDSKVQSVTTEGRPSLQQRSPLDEK